jgi:hypothetical protein
VGQRFKEFAIFMYRDISTYSIPSDIKNIDQNINAAASVL